MTDQGEGTNVEPPPEGPVLLPEGRLRRRARQARLYGWATLLVAALIVIVALIVDNTRRVEIGWVFGSTHTSLVWIIVVPAIVGWFAGLATSVVIGRRLSKATESRSHGG